MSIIWEHAIALAAIARLCAEGRRQECGKAVERYREQTPDSSTNAAVLALSCLTPRRDLTQTLLN